MLIFRAIKDATTGLPVGVRGVSLPVRKAHVFMNVYTVLLDCLYDASPEQLQRILNATWMDIVAHSRTRSDASLEQLRIYWDCAQTGIESAFAHDSLILHSMPPPKQKALNRALAACAWQRLLRDRIRGALLRQGLHPLPIDLQDRVIDRALLVAEPQRIRT